MLALWAAYRALSGLKALAVNGGIILAVLAAVYGYHWNAKRVAFNEGYAHAIARIEKANKRAGDVADGGEAKARECHAREDRGEKVKWNRRARKCESR